MQIFIKNNGKWDFMMLRQLCRILGGLSSVLSRRSSSAPGEELSGVEGLSVLHTAWGIWKGEAPGLFVKLPEPGRRKGGS